jgi:PAS domain S-box-containing protein
MGRRMRSLPLAPVEVPRFGAPRPRTEHLGTPASRRAIWALALGLAAGAAALFLTVIVKVPNYDEHELPWPFFALAFAAAEIGVIHLSVRGQAVTVSLAEIPLVIGFYFASPELLVLSQLLGTAVALVVVRRQAPVKLVFNLALFTLTTSIAVVVFRALAPPGLDDVLAWWMASFAGTSAVVLVSAPAITAAISISVRQFQRTALVSALVFGIAAAAVNTSLALLVVVFLRTRPQELWLVLAPALVVGLGYRAYASQRERQARIEFLYDCARILQGSFLDADTIAALLTRTREMLHADLAEIVLSSGVGEPHPMRAASAADGTMQLATRTGKEVLAARLALLGPTLEARLLRAPFADPDLAARLAAAGFTDALIVPLRGDENAVGTLAVGNRQVHRGPFDLEDLRLLETLGVHAGVALQNSGLVDRLAESLASVTRLAAAVQASDDAILAIDADGAITAWNPAAERLFGYPGSELGGIAVDVLVPPAAEDEVRDAFGGVKATDGPRHGITAALRSDGATVPVSVTVSPISGATGDLLGLSAIVRDETRRTQADAALRESVERFRRVFQDSPIGMALADEELRWTAVNDALCRILDRSEDELLGQRFDAFIHPDDVEEADRFVDDVLAHEASTGVASERRYVIPDGRIVWARVTQRPLRDAVTGAARMICMLEDITESRLATQRVRDTEERLRRAVTAFTAVREPANVLRAVLAAARDLLDAEFAGIGVLSDDGSAIAEMHFDGIDETAIGRIGLAPGLNGMLGLTDVGTGPTRIRDVAQHPDALGFPTGHPVITSFIAVPVVFEDRLIARLFAGNKRNALEFDREDEDVASALAAQAAVALENARVNARTLELITELDEANAGLRKANDAKSEFLGTISHELRTPLHSILVAAQLVHDPMFGPLTEERARQLGSTIQGSGRHLLGLIDDLVDLSRIEADRIELRPVDLSLARLLEEVRQEIEPIASDRGVSLEAAADPALRIHADPLRIRQVLINLVVNAVKYSGPKGRVWVEAQGGARETMIAVYDTGPGIPEQDLARIFEPFEQIAGVASTGAGLGLAIARRLVELHGGRLEVSSTVGLGSTFTVTLPVKQAVQRQAITQDPADTERQEVAQNRSTILVVEDDDTALGLISEVLRRSGHDVWQASDLAEATEHLGAGLPSLVLLDIRLGVESGLDLARSLRRDPATAKIPILALSADAMQHDRERAAEAGCDAHLAKPVVARELLACISRLLEQAATDRDGGGAGIASSTPARAG